MMSAGRGLLEGLARAPVLLVGCDFDGVLSPIVDRPEGARPDPAAAEALLALHRLGRTHVAVVSGRGLEDLRGRVGALSSAVLVGSHGAESSLGDGATLDPDSRHVLDRLTAALEVIAASAPGSLIEHKPLSVAFHYRGCGDEVAERALRAVLEGPAQDERVVRKDGHKVVELCLSSADKGAALLGLRQRFGAAATLYIGDDLTDEHAFAVLQPGDIGVKVGPGETRAHARLASQEEVAGLLRLLGEMRKEWLDSSRPTPIERHSLLSDQRTMALVDPRGRIVWLCLPRGDSTAVFAELLGGPERGYFSVEPFKAGGDPVQEYAGDTFILRTRWDSMTVTDYFDCSGGRAYQRAGRSDLVRVVEGKGKALVRFSPRLDFGRMPTELVVSRSGVTVEGSGDPFVLFAPGVSWRLEGRGPDRTAVARIDLDKGPVVLEMRYGFGNLQAARMDEAYRRDQTEKFWSGWAQTLQTPRPASALVRRSALVLKALCYGPTGAIYAAATTSLPEQLGGVRNWDYRYCWPRDACMAASALVRLGNTGLAMKLLDWLVGVVAHTENPERLHPLYSVSGHSLGQEGEIGELRGYGDSRPVRIGNAADKQVQLDVFGPIVSLVAMLVERGAPVTPEHWRLVEAMVGAVAARWSEPDHGIWEVRGPRRHHVHTKTMCWHAVDCGLRVAESVLGRTRGEWAALRDRIRADVLEHGWSERAGAYTTAYASDDLDAAALWVGLSGLTPPDDERFVSTVRAVERHLLEGPAVYRYRFDDGLPGVEGGFNICTSWLIESLVLIGERGRAEELFEAMAGLAGPTGLMSEEHDPASGLALGNFPQAYSHLGLINAAVALDGA